MARGLVKNGNGLRSTASKYDAHNTVLSKTYGALAELRRELSDSKADVAEREDLLRTFSACADSQRAWLLLEDYFEKLSLSRKDFPATDWWPQVLSAQGKARLEEVAFLFLRAKRSLPSELGPYGNLVRFAQVEQAAQERQLVQCLESWIFPPRPAHLDAPRASLRVLCRPQPDDASFGRHRMAVQFHLLRPRTGEKLKTIGELVDLTTRAAHEQELFAPEDWDFVLWLAQTREGMEEAGETVVLSELDLLHWLTRWGHTSRLELATDTPGAPQALQFLGDVAELTPYLENENGDLAFTHRLTLPTGALLPLSEVLFFNQRPPLVLAQSRFYLLRNAPPSA
ncbi:MAG TPA: ATP-dependent helicase, partial [Clostridia bacterium]|nr:ATP-dependent helicase [Clostridia bacterium]